MKNKLIKPLSLGMTCLTLALLLNIGAQGNSKTVKPPKTPIIITPDEWAPWG